MLAPGCQGLLEVNLIGGVYGFLLTFCVCGVLLPFAPAPVPPLVVDVGVRSLPLFDGEFHEGSACSVGAGTFILPVSASSSMLPFLSPP